MYIIWFLLQRTVFIVPPNTPSETDKKQFEELREEQQSQDLPFVQIIHGSNGLFVTAVM